MRLSGEVRTATAADALMVSTSLEGRRIALLMRAGAATYMYELSEGDAAALILDLRNELARIRSGAVQ